MYGVYCMDYQYPVVQVSGRRAAAVRQRGACSWGTPQPVRRLGRALLSACQASAPQRLCLEPPCMRELLFGT